MLALYFNNMKSRDKTILIFAYATNVGGSEDEIRVLFGKMVNTFNNHTTKVKHLIQCYINNFNDE